MKKAPRNKGQSFTGLIRSIVVGAAAFLLLFTMLLTGVTPDQYDISVRQPASKTIYATKDVEDTVTTNALREAAANAVEPSYKNADAGTNEAVLSDLQAEFSALSDIRRQYTIESETEITDTMLADASSAAGFKLSREMLADLLICTDDALSKLTGICVSEVRDALNSTLPEGQESAAITRIARLLTEQGFSAAQVTIATEAMRLTVQPNMLIDSEITEANRQKARDAVEPEMLVKREVIVREGEIVTEAQYQMIASLGLLADDNLDVSLMGGLALLVLMLCAVIALYLYMFKPEYLKNTKNLLLLCIIVVLEIAISLVTRQLHTYLMPVSLAVILIAILLDGKTAIFVNCVLSILVSLLVSSDSLFSMTMFSVLLMAFISGPAAVWVLSQRHMRTGTFLAGCVIALVNFITTMAMGLINSVNLNTALINAVWAFGSGILSAVLAIGLQTLLEWLFNIATNAKLIELSNPNQPLLRRLLLEASGTYHHSIIVANLAEAGATAVGANGMLARVGAYYHDIGKLKRPMYFKENQMGDNPHDRTDPRVSAAILIAHPRDGQLMAQKQRLPEPIQDIIRQHHGDSPTLYFYDKAKKLYGDDVDISAFRYEGPRPRTKEAAVVMLADTIEAAMRTLPNPSPEKMEQLIRKLVRDKMNDGQLNDSSLTFSDLERICSAFSTVLTGVFHERIEYPDINFPPRETENADAAANETGAPNADSAENAPAKTEDTQNAD